MKAIGTIVVAVLGAVVAGQTEHPPPAIQCEAIKAPTVPGATVVSVKAAEMRNMRVRMMNGTMATVSYCDANITLTHGTAGDRVLVEVWMPLSGWNMRFQGTGGSGFLAGLFAPALAPQLMAGFAAASTDAGVGSAGLGGMAVAPNSTLSAQLLTNFGYLSIHDMAVAAKDVINQFYGMAAMKSYFNGCSTGGRQGMMEAQMYPQDFDGILAGAPAMNWPKFVVAELWPYTVMNAAGTFPPACVLNAFTAAVVAACDGLDGAADGIVSLPGACRFDASTVVGKSVACNGSSVAVTAQQAQVFQQILQGPRSPSGEQLWYGLLPGASATTLATRTPSGLGATWVSKFVLAQQGISAQSAQSTLQSIDPQSFPTLLDASQTQFDAVIGTDDPDLASFNAAGGKLLSWHGLADQLIFPNGTFDYRQRVEDLMGSGDAVDQFYRVFAAPGVQHCAGGVGPEPTDPLDVLVRWVENGSAPDTLPAMKMAQAGSTTTKASGVITRNLCRYPSVLQYKGVGDASLAESWGCAEASPQQVLTELTASEEDTSILATASAARKVRPASVAAALAIPAALAALALL